MRRTSRPWPVEFTVEGLNVERFVRCAGEHGLRLSNMRRSAPRRLIGLVAEEQLPALQEAAVSGGWKLTVGRRKGAGHILDWLRRRWLLAAAGMAAGIALFGAAQVMWQVEIIDGGTYAADIRAALKDMGVTAPMLRSQVDIGELRDTLEWRYPRIAWFECGWRGTTLVVRPVEGVLPRKDEATDGSCDVIAVRDGVIKSIVTHAGTPAVEPGDIVRQGEVLIRGEERTSEGLIRPVAARGIVTARVWEGASVIFPAYETVTVYTGSTDTVWTIRTPWFDLWQMEASSYLQYDTEVKEIPIGGLFLPMTLRIEKRLEAECTTQLRDMEELKAEAYEAAVRKLHEKVGLEESLIDIWGNCSMIEAEKVQSFAIGEMLVDIGVRSPVSGMAAPDQVSPQ